MLYIRTTAACRTSRTEVFSPHSIYSKARIVCYTPVPLWYALRISFYVHNRICGGHIDIVRYIIEMAMRRDRVIERECKAKLFTCISSAVVVACSWN